MSISFKGLNESSATFEIGGVAEVGYVVKMSGNGMVGSCSLGNDFFGVIKAIETDAYATIQVSGYVEVPYTDAVPTIGFCILCANGMGGVKVASGGGRTHLVLNVDTAAKTVGFLL